MSATVCPDGWRVEVIGTRNGEVLRVRRQAVIGGHGAFTYAPAHTANLAGVRRNACSNALFTCTTLSQPDYGMKPGAELRASAPQQSSSPAGRVRTSN